MMNNEEMICVYDDVAKITQDMRESAKCHDWGRFSELEQNCRQYAEKASKHRSVAPLSREAIDRKMASLKRIMENDREIREVLEPWQQRLADMMTLKRHSNVAMTASCNR